MSIMEAQPNVLLPNVAQNCWLNVTINMLTAVGASDRIYTFLMLCNLRTAAYLFFQMLKSQNIDRNIVSQFAADCIYKMRVQKVSLTEVELYRKGTCQDAFEALLTIFFPMMEEAGIHFKLSTDTPLITLSSPQDNIRNSILEIIPGGVTNLPQTSYLYKLTEEVVLTTVFPLLSLMKFLTLGLTGKTLFSVLSLLIQVAGVQAITQST